MTYDVWRVREAYALSSGWTHLNAHDCPQIPERVSVAVAQSFRAAPHMAAPGSFGASGAFGTARPEGAAFRHAAHEAVADLTGAKPECVVLGPSLPALYAALSLSMGPALHETPSVVLNPLDAPALTVAAAHPVADIRWAQPDLGTADLPAWQYETLVDDTTSLVCLPAAHSLVGNVVDVAGIIRRVRGNSPAWVLVDASAYLPYRRVDLAEWGCDIVGVDIGALGGPQLAALVFRDEEMFEQLGAIAPYGYGEGAGGLLGVEGAEKLALDLAPGLAGGVAPLVEQLAGLPPEALGSWGSLDPVERRARLHYELDELSAYLASLGEDMYSYLGDLPSVHIVGVSGEAAFGATTDRIPRLSFAVPGVPSDVVYQRLVANGVITTITPASPLLSEMGVDDIGGAVTASLSPFTTPDDVEHLVRVVASLA